MSCKLLSVNGTPNSSYQKEYLLQSEDEVDKLPKYGIRGTLEDSVGSGDINSPCAFGSIALVCDTSAVYILAPNNEWTLM